jgi:hypothetical protein
MTAGTTYHLHFTMNSGSNLGGDARYGLVYYKSIDSVTPANNVYGELYPSVLSAFNYQPTAADAAKGGTLLPMMRLVFSGSSTFLPVKLTSLSALRTASGAVRIDWKTAAEDNVYDFEINRSTSGSDGVLAGATHAENAEHGASYALLDAEAPSTAVLYDLIERDLDGSRQSLGRVEVAAAPGVSDPLSLAVYPNPAVDRLTVVGSEPLQTVSLIDPLGKIVTSIAASGNRLTLDLTGVAPGSYFLEASGAQNVRRIKISITR